MGCSSSKPASSPTAAPQVVYAGTVNGQLASDAVNGQLVGPAPAAMPSLLCSELPKTKGTGKGKGKGKGKGGVQRWQIQLEGQWKDYEEQENAILKRAYMIGQNNAKFDLRGQKYEYSFRRMVQKNLNTGKERRIRAPWGPGPPKKPILPQGPMTIITVGTGQPGTIVPIKDPNNPGKSVQVFVPPHAKPGQKMAVPLPQKGQAVEEVQKKQEQHDKDHGTKTSPWSTGAKVAAGGTAVAGVAAVGVGGVILGDYLAGGEMATTIGEGAIDVGEDIADWAAPAAEAAGDWLTGAAEDAGDWLTGAGEDAVDWLGDAGEDIGDFVMDFF